MCKPNHLLKRGSVYYVRVRVPTDLLDHFHPKKDLVRSLRTSDYKEACIKVRTASLQIIKEFEELRKLKASRQTTITPDEIKRVADLWTAHILEGDEEVRFEGLDDPEFADLVETNDVALAATKIDLAKGKWKDDWLLSEMDDFSESLGFHLDKSSDSYKALAVAFLKATVTAFGYVRQRNQGEVVETPKALPVAPSGCSDGVPTLAQLVSRFLAKADQTKSMFKKYNAVLPLFRDFVGDRSVDQLKQIDIENFCHFICKLPPRWTDQVRQRKITPMQLVQEDHPKTISPKPLKSYLTNTVMRSPQGG